MYPPTCAIKLLNVPADVVSRLVKGIKYLKEAGLGGDNQDVRVAFIFHSQQLILWGAIGTKLERCAGPSDLPFVGHITELVELAVVIGHIISFKKRVNPVSVTVKTNKASDCIHINA